MQKYPPGADGPRVAVEGIETEAGRHIVLFTTFDLSLRDAGGLLADAGLRGVMRLDEVRASNASRCSAPARRTTQACAAWSGAGRGSVP